MSTSAAERRQKRSSAISPPDRRATWIDEDDTELAAVRCAGAIVHDLRLRAHGRRSRPRARLPDAARRSRARSCCRSDGRSPGAALHLPLRAGGTYPEFGAVDVRTLPINSLALLRRHRLALPLLAPSFSRLHIEADVVVCSSSGWAHGARVAGRKVVYCHTPARWLYQHERYLGTPGRRSRAALAACYADRSSDGIGAPPRAPTAIWRTQPGSPRRSPRIYGLDAEVVHPPVSIDADGRATPLDGVEPGYVLCVSRLLPYKNVEAVVAAFAAAATSGSWWSATDPTRNGCESAAGANVILAGSVGDAELRWLYENARCLVAASYEDFGLTPVEAAAFGKPTAALRFGGFLDTIREGETGVLLRPPDPHEIAAASDGAFRHALERRRASRARRLVLRGALRRRLQEIVGEELSAARPHAESVRAAAAPDDHRDRPEEQHDVLPQTTSSSRRGSRA